MRKLFLILFIFIFTSAIVFASCCKETKQGQYCVQGVSQDVCKVDSWTSQDCALTSGCDKKVCCEVDDKCFKGKTETECFALKGNPLVDPTCSVSQCSKQVCCDVSGTYYMADKSDCSAENVISGVEDPVVCNQMNTQSNIGVCRLKSNPNCFKTNEADCNAKCDSANNDCFFAGENCANVAGCDNKAHYKIAPKEGDNSSLYWYDSGGCIEDKKEECNIAFGFIPMKNENDESYSCKSLNCDNVWDNPFTDENFDGDLNDAGMKRLNGESWCEYQQVQVGLGRDLPGTHHYAHYCEAGKEVAKPVGPANFRGEYCVESRLNGFSEIIKGKKSSETGITIPNGCSGTNEPEVCSLTEGCTWVPVKGVLGWKVYFATRSGTYSPGAISGDTSPSYASFNLNDKYNLYSESGSFLQQITWNDLIIKPSETESYYHDLYRSSNGFGGYSYTTRSFVFIESNLIEPNKEYYVVEVLEGGVESKDQIKFNTNPPEGTEGKCVPVVPLDYPSDALTLNFECKSPIFKSNDIRDWIGWAWDVPMNINFYVFGLNQYGKIDTVDWFRLQFLLEMSNRMANSYNSRCGVNYDYTGKFSGKLSWDVDYDAIGTNATEQNVFVGPRGYKNEPYNQGIIPFYMVKYGYVDSSYLKVDLNSKIGGPIRPEGTVYE